MMRKESRSRQWPLDKYAFHIPTTKPCEDENTWKIFSHDVDVLRVLVTDSDHLLVTVGGKIQESYSLIDAKSWMRGVSKGDSLLLLCKQKGNNRRFRIKFVGGEYHGKKACEEVSSLLRKYFPVKELTASGLPQTSTAAAPWEGEVEISQLAKMALGELSPALPLVYKETNLPLEDLGLLVRLCLTDVNFPAFVGAVEAELQKATQDINS